jgi:hypothetical protein
VPVLVPPVPAEPEPVLTDRLETEDGAVGCAAATPQTLQYPSSMVPLHPGWVHLIAGVVIVGLRFGAGAAPPAGSR